MPEAVAFTLENALPGDLVIVFYESYEKVVNVVEAFSNKEKQQKNNCLLLCKCYPKNKLIMDKIRQFKAGKTQVM